MEIVICSVDEEALLSFLKVSMDSSLTFKQTTYSISFITFFSDYADEDIITVEIVNN